MQNKKEPSVFLKIWWKHRQMISSKFPKSFRGAGDLVVFYRDFSGYLLDVQKLTNYHQVTSTP